MKIATTGYLVVQSTWECVVLVAQADATVLQKISVRPVRRQVVGYVVCTGEGKGICQSRNQVFWLPRGELQKM
jgi:hypothetical protein